MVTGASGQLGAKVMEFLLEKDHGPLIAGSRQLEKLQQLKTEGVELRQADFNNQKDLEKSFVEVDKLLIISTDSIAEPGLRLKQHLNALSAAKAAGVKHIVYTSLTGADHSPISFAPDHKGSEEAIKNSGIPYTILRNNWYAENLLDSIAQAKKNGSLVTSTGKGKVAFITREDCARVAASILLSDNYKDQILEVTGEESVSYADLAEKINVKNVSVEEEEMRKALASHGLPSFVVDLVATYEKAVAQNDQDVTNNLVFEVTGRRPISIDQFLAIHHLI